MSSRKFPASIPRVMYWSDEVGGSFSCPNCGAALEAEYHFYLMTTPGHKEADFHMVGNTAGRFCGRCPLVVLDRAEFQRSAALSAPGAGGAAVTVMGIVDTDAVPKDKQDVPFGDDNPIPLVQFTNVEGGRLRATSPKTDSQGLKSKKRKKRRW
jgi:hypothetical protein